LEWGIKYGDDLEFFKSLKERGLDSPLDSRPSLGTVEVFYYNDFAILGTERINGGPLPITRISQYATMEGVLDVELFKRIILELDNTYLKLSAEERKKAATKAKAKKKVK
jgi:hypothetical protein